MDIDLNFKFSYFIGFITSIIFASCSSNLPTGSFKSEIVDPNTLYFSGEYSSVNGEPTFRDCATGCSYTLLSTDQIISEINIDYAKITESKGGSIFATCKGHIIDGRELYVEDVMRFELGYNCTPTPIIGVYISNRDTLTLHGDYNYTYSYTDGRKQELLEGVWGRNYDDKGVLFIDKDRAIPFAISFEEDKDKEGVSLTLNSIEEKEKVLLPR